MKHHKCLRLTDDERQFYMSLNQSKHRKWNMKHSFSDGLIVYTPIVSRINANGKRDIKPKSSHFNVIL